MDRHDLHKTVTRASASCDPNEFSIRQTNMPSSLICTFSIFKLLSDKILELQQAFQTKTCQLNFKLLTLNIILLSNGLRNPENPLLNPKTRLTRQCPEKPA